MKLLTFLGTQRYESVIYHLPDGREYETPLFPEALVEWYQPSEVFVFLTPAAKKHTNWVTLRDRLEPKVKLFPVDIPTGRSEGELWQIFDRLTKCLKENDKVIFDVTHAFRSLPILALLAASYLRVVKSIMLQAILYGAYEARDESGRVPVFDLTPFLSLLDWAEATARFIETGDAKPLAELLHEAHRHPWKSTAVPPQELPRHLQKIAATLENLFHALLLAQPLEVAEYAEILTKQLRKAAPEAEKWAPPFALLLKRVEESYLPLTKGDLNMQLALVRWYVELGRITQALILAREWIISWACESMGVDFLDFRKRQEVENALNQAVQEKIESGGRSILEKDSPVLYRLRDLPAFRELLDAWCAIRELRNNVAHCGMRSDALSSKNILTNARKMLFKLEKLPLEEADR